MPQPKFEEVFGHFLRRIRLGLGSTQVQFSDKLGISQSTLSRLEVGDGGLTLEVINQVMDAMGMDVAALCRTLLNHELKKAGRPPSGTPNRDE